MVSAGGWTGRRVGVASGLGVACLGSGWAGSPSWPGRCLVASCEGRGLLVMLLGGGLLGGLWLAFLGFGVAGRCLGRVEGRGAVPGGLAWLLVGAGVWAGRRGEGSGGRRGGRGVCQVIAGPGGRRSRAGQFAGRARWGGRLGRPDRRGGSGGSTGPGRGVPANHVPPSRFVKPPGARFLVGLGVSGLAGCSA